MLKVCRRLLAVSLLGALLIVLRYILRTPQALDSVLPGESRLYRWRYGHIFYKVAGDPTAPALVLLHAPGIGSSGYEMRRLIDGLGQRYRVYTPDLIGMGLSDRPALDYSAGTYISLCRDFLRDVVGKPAVLVASGLSCQYSVAVAASSPELCQRLALLSPEVLARSQQQPAWLTCLAEFPLLRFVLYATLTIPPLLRLEAQREGAAADEEALKYRSASAHQLGAQHAVLALLAGKLAIDVSTQLRALKQPVQLLWSETRQQQTPGSHLLPGRVTLIRGIDEPVHEAHAELVIAEIVAASAEPSHNGNAAREQIKIESTRPAQPTTDPAQAQQYEKPVELSNGTKEESSAANESTQAYCMKCRQKRAIEGAHRITTKNGRSALAGKCQVCGTRLFRFTAS